MPLRIELFPRTKSILYGLSLPWVAFKLIISRPILMFWSILPIGITLSLYIFVITRLQNLAKTTLGSYFMTWGLDPSGWIAWSALLLAQIALFLIGALTFSIVASITASPFNDFLAEHAERWTTPPLPPVSVTNIAGRVRLIAIDVAKTLAATGATILALLISWVPVLNLIAFITAFLLVAFQYISYPQTRRGQGLREGFLFLWKHFYACAAFGAIMSLLFSIPIVSSFSLPLAVVGGTLLVARSKGGPELRPLR